MGVMRHWTRVTSAMEKQTDTPMVPVFLPLSDGPLGHPPRCPARPRRLYDLPVPVGARPDRAVDLHIAAFFLAPIAGLAFLASAAGALPAIGVALLGLGLGTEIDLIAFLVTRYLGQRSFGELYGCFFMVFGIGSSLGRFLGGLVFDRVGYFIAVFPCDATSVQSRRSPAAY